MKTFKIGKMKYQVPDIIFSGENDAAGNPVMEVVEEGEYKGIKFTLTDMHMDEKDESLLWYDLNAVDEKNSDKLMEMKESIDNFILSLLVDSIKRMKRENKATK